MKAPGRRPVFLAIVALVFIGCSENVDLFSSLDQDTGPELSTVHAGAIIADAEELSVQIDYPSEDASRATEMTVVLRTPDGEEYGRVEFGPEELAEPELPPLRLPEPPDGVYVLQAEARLNDQTLFSERRQLFVLDDAPTVERLDIHPATVVSGVDALGVAELFAPAGTRPYLRWVFHGTTAAEGYAEAGFDRAVLTTGEGFAGAYDVTLELYPWGPEEGAVIDGSTEITTTAEVFVRRQPALASGEELWDGPGELVSYYGLDGTRTSGEPAGTSAAPESDGEDQSQITGAGVLDIAGGALGYRFAPDAVVGIPLPSGIHDAGGDPRYYLVSARVQSSSPLALMAGADAERGTVSPDGAAVQLIETVAGDGGFRLIRVVVAVGTETVRMIGLSAGGTGSAIELPRDRYAVPEAVFLSTNDDGEFFVDSATLVALSPTDLSALQERFPEDTLRSVLSEPVQLGRSDPPPAPSVTGGTEAAQPDGTAGVGGIDVVLETADTIPVAMLVPEGGAVGLLRAGGWRGTVRRVANSLILETTDGARVDSIATGPGGDRIAEGGDSIDAPESRALFALVQVVPAGETEAPRSAPWFAYHGGTVELRIPRAWIPGVLSLQPDASDALSSVWVGSGSR